MSRPSSHFRDQASEARLGRMWSALDARFDQAERRRRFMRVATMIAAPCALALMLYLGWPRAEGPQSILLADGSQVEHASGQQLQIESVSPERVAVRMGEGRATFRIARNPAREFVTHVGGYTVRVLGTEYVLELRGDSLRVDVSRGAVEVRRNASGDVWRVRAGESWSSTRKPESAAAPARPARDHAEPTPSDAMPSDAIVEKVPGPVPARRVASRGKRSTAREPSLEPEAGDAVTLFQRAQEERLAGRSETAARSLSELIERFPDDARVGVSAYELARLRLDLGDPAGALRALDRARAAGYAQPEQIDMRRVQALEEAGDVAGCRQAREAFLERFPHSSFRAMVRRRCP